MTDKYVAPYIPFAMVDVRSGFPTAPFQAFWKATFENAVLSAEAAAAAAASAAEAQTTATGAVDDAAAANANANGRQPASTSLTALSALSGTGLVEQTGPNAFTDRAIGVATAASIPTRADADGRYVGKDGTAAPSYPAYGGQTVSAGYVQAEAQATDNAVKAASTALAALIVKLQAIHALT